VWVWWEGYVCLLPLTWRVALTTLVTLPCDRVIQRRVSHINANCSPLYVTLRISAWCSGVSVWKSLSTKSFTSLLYCIFNVTKFAASEKFDRVSIGCTNVTVTILTGWYGVLSSRQLVSSHSSNVYCETATYRPQSGSADNFNRPHTWPLITDGSVVRRVSILFTARCVCISAVYAVCPSVRHVRGSRQKE